MIFKRNLSIGQKWLAHLSIETLPKDKFTKSFTRSSGPGGQKVNKTSSKAMISLNSFTEQEWIPIEIKEQLITKKFRYLTKNDGLIIMDDTSRSQDQNLRNCYGKLIDEIKRTVYFEKDISEEDKKKWCQVRERTNERRIKEKKLKSQKKQSRKFRMD